MGERLAALSPPMAQRRVFLSTYQRTTAAVGEAIEQALFEDPAWVERWDVVFAELYLDAHDADLAGRSVPRPWQLAFEAPVDLTDLRPVLLGISAHINYHLPQALIGVISESDFEDQVLIDRRRRDHERIDGVLPARLAGPDAYAASLTELELLSAAKIADLLEPGQVLLRLAVAGFGVTDAPSVAIAPPGSREPDHCGRPAPRFPRFLQRAPIMLGPGPPCAPVVRFG